MTHGDQIVGILHDPPVNARMTKSAPTASQRATQYAMDDSTSAHDETFASSARMTKIAPTVSQRATQYAMDDSASEPAAHETGPGYLHGTPPHERGARHHHNRRQDSQPGAYGSGVVGTAHLERRTAVDYSLVGSGAGGHDQVNTESGNGPSPSLNDGLVEAREVDPVDSDLMQAQQVDPKEMEKRQAQKKKEKECFRMSAALIVVAILIIIGAVVASQTRNIAEEEGQASQPTVVPSLSPTVAPSSFPTAILGSLTLSILTSNSGLLFSLL